MRENKILFIFCCIEETARQYGFYWNGEGTLLWASLSI